MLIKINTTNFLVWQNKIIFLVCDISFLHHILSGEPIEKIKDDERNKSFILIWFQSS